MEKLRKSITNIHAKGIMKDDDRHIKNIIDKLNYVDESRRKCLFKQNSEFYLFWVYVQIAFKWQATILLPLLTATKRYALISDTITTQLFYMLLFNVFDAFFRLTSEKIINQKVNPYLSDCALNYVKSQMIFDIAIIFSTFCLLYLFRVNIV